MTRKDRGPKRKQAAAICWRFKKGELQFLLVTTRKRRRWTFPKGKIEKGESLWQTARREAREEARVKGEIFHDPVFQLRRTTSAGRIIPMSFFLLKWKRRRKGKGRDTKWVPFAEAGRLLRARPDRAYGVGLEKALTKAKARLDCSNEP